MNKTVKTYSEFIVESVSINESLADKLKPALDKLTTMFKDPKKLNAQVDRSGI